MHDPWEKERARESAERKHHRDMQHFHEREIARLFGHAPRRIIEQHRQAVNDCRLRVWGWTGKTPTVAPME